MEKVLSVFGALILIVGLTRFCIMCKNKIIQDNKRLSISLQRTPQEDSDYPEPYPVPVYARLQS